jgi:hypothetical protein
MPITTTEITRYEVNVISAGDPNYFAATVWLYDANQSVVAFLRFYPDGRPLAPNEFRQDLNTAVVSYPLLTLPSVVDVLRNEKPVYFTWFDYTPIRCFGTVGTSLEPIGEQEGV